MYVAKLDQNFVKEAVLPKLSQELLDKFSQRVADFNVGFLNTQIDPNKLSVVVVVRKGQEIRNNRLFQFNTWVEYENESEFNSHLRRTISSFVYDF